MFPSQVHPTASQARISLLFPYPPPPLAPSPSQLYFNFVPNPYSFFSLCFSFILFKLFHTRSSCPTPGRSRKNRFFPPFFQTEIPLIPLHSPLPVILFSFFFLRICIQERWGIIISYNKKIFFSDLVGGGGGVFKRKKRKKSKDEEKEIIYM